MQDARVDLGMATVAHRLEFDPRHKKPVFGVSNKVPLKPDCTTTEEVRGLKFWIKEAEGLYYQCRENKGTDQLWGYCTADLRLCFRICKNRVFYNAAHILYERGSHII